MEEERAIQFTTNLVGTIVQSVVDDEKAVTIQIRAGGTRTVLCVCVAPADIGKVIGTQGRTVESIRKILSGIGMKLKHQFSLEIVQETGATKIKI